MISIFWRVWVSPVQPTRVRKRVESLRGACQDLICHTLKKCTSVVRSVLHTRVTIDLLECLGGVDESGPLRAVHFESGPLRAVHLSRHKWTTLSIRVERLSMKGWREICAIRAFEQRRHRAEVYCLGLRVQGLGFRV